MGHKGSPRGQNQGPRDGAGSQRKRSQEAGPSAGRGAGDVSQADVRASGQRGLLCAKNFPRLDEERLELLRVRLHSSALVSPGGRGTANDLPN